LQARKGSGTIDKRQTEGQQQVYFFLLQKSAIRLSIYHKSVTQRRKKMTRLNWDDHYEYELKVTGYGTDSMTYTVERHYKMPPLPKLVQPPPPYQPSTSEQAKRKAFAARIEARRQKHLAVVAAKKKEWEEKVQNSCWLKRMYFRFIDYFCFCCCTRKKCVERFGFMHCTGVNSWHYK
jgi:hypothetical protein